MREIAKTFSALNERGEGALIAYVAAGDPTPSHTPSIVESLIKGGADIIELGIPFSDPIADGPTIQAASVRALKAGITPKKVFKIAEEIREKYKQPLVTMTYYNSIFRMGLENFFESASSSEISGVIVPDLPIEEADEYKKLADSYEIDTIFFIAPSTSPERMKKTLEYTSGFLYLVSVFGVTGARTKVQELTINLIKVAHAITNGKVPLAVGFGISEPDHVRTILKNGADAAIVGSAFVKIIEKNHEEKDLMLKTLEEYTNKLKKATIK
ncbi:MAG: tryptophan synthase subunit alpha [Candidatus Helarchaeota archaeon]|nr:tryptophan synthase subunit alpha [Candidatus Helarchaeota archaeon]